MADIISRLKLESGEFDSKIKRAGQELMAYSEHCRKTGLEMGYTNRDAKDFAKALGNMQTTSSTVRGQINELSDAFVNLRVMYRNMTDEEKNNEFGKNLAASLDQIKQRAKEAREELEKATRELSAGSSMPGIADKFSGMLQVFGGNMMTKAADMAINAFTSLASEISDCVTQGIQLANQGEGIRNAFERLGRGDILDGLRQATHGTVTDIELMKAAVKFNDFKLPLDELGTMLAFAQKKAKDTGESVDYMVNSIVTGLGRKSLMILDNLGLSATEVKDKMKETGDMTKAVGAIIREQMAKAGDYVETAADRAAQANVSLQNKMEELGRKFAPVEEASNQLWTSMKIGILDVVGGPLARLLNGLTEAGRMKNMLNDLNGDGGNTKVGNQLSALRGSNYKNAKYNSQVAQYDQDIRDAEQLRNKYQDTGWAGGGLVLGDISRRFDVKVGGIEDIENLIATLKTMREEYRKGAKDILTPIKIDIDTSDAGQSVESLRVKLAELEAQYKKAVAAGDTDLSKNLRKQINQTKSDIKALGGTLKDTINKVCTVEEQNSATIKRLTEEYVRATDDRRTAIRDEIKGLQDRNKEIRRLKDEAQGLTFADGSLPVLTQQLREYQALQAKALDGKEWRSYQKSIDDTIGKIDMLKGILPRDKEAVFTIEVKADDFAKIAELQSLSFGDKTIRVNVEQGDVGLPDVPTDDKSIRVNLETGENTLPEWLTEEDGKTATITIVAETQDAMDEVQDMVQDIEGTELTFRPKIDLSEFGDGSELSDAMSVQLYNAADNLDLTGFAKIFASKLADGAGDMDLSPFIEYMKTTIGDKIDEEDWPKIKIAIETGDLKEIENYNKKLQDAAKSTKDAWKQAAGAISNLGNALQNIEDPGVKAAGTVMAAVANAALAFATAAKGPFGNAWEYIAFAATGIATMITTINAIHNATGMKDGGVVKAAGGTFVPGTTYSGDQVPAMLNSGELILNRAQQGIIAQELEGGGYGNIQMEAVIGAEEIMLVTNNRGRRTQRGEYVQSNNRRG